jgi:hypothetical protein
MIFISYRRQDSLAEVENLRVLLAGRYGEGSVFVDDRNIPAGERWPEFLQQEIANRTILLAVVGPTWGEARIESGPDQGRLRLDDANDWVRQEICTALRTNKRVVVVLIDDAQLPGTIWNSELDQLPKLQHARLRNRQDFERLCVALEQYNPELKSAAQEQRQHAAPLRHTTALVTWQWAMLLALICIGFVIGELVIGYFLPAVIELRSSTEAQPSDLTKYITAGHVVVITLFLLVHYLFIVPARANDGREERAAERAYRRFAQAWSLAWAAWLAQYIWQWACWSVPYWHQKQPEIMWSFSEILSMLKAFEFYCCFLVLDMPSVNTFSEPNRAAPFFRRVLSLGILGLWLGLLLILARTNVVPLIRFTAPFAAGCYITLALAFFFGRLDSWHLRAPRAVLAPLYIYVAIQLPWTAFSGDMPPSLRTLFMGLALILKVWMFVVVSVWLKDGSFWRYFQAREESDKRRNC